jgi:hypothetical protein
MCLRVKKERWQYRNKKLTAQLPLLREVDSYENPKRGHFTSVGVWKLEELIE